MPSAAYFRRQADICLRLSLIASDDVVSSRLVTMARDYMAASEAMERAAAAPPAAGGDTAHPAHPLPDAGGLPPPGSDHRPDDR
jgi:hypothetical protein